MSVPISNFSTQEYPIVPFSLSEQEKDLTPTLEKEEVQHINLQEKYFTCLYQGDYGMARLLIEQQPQFKKELLQSHLDNVNFCFEHNNLGGALHQIEMYLNIFPNNLSLLKSQAYILFFRGEQEKVKKICETVCKLSHKIDWEESAIEIDQKEKEFRFICSKFLMQQDRCHEAYFILMPFIRDAMHEKVFFGEISFLASVCYRNNKNSDVRGIVGRQFANSSEIGSLLMGGEMLLPFSKGEACQYYRVTLEYFLKNRDSRSGKYFLTLTCLALLKHNYEEAKGFFEYALRRGLTKEDFDDRIGNRNLEQNSRVDEYIKFGRFDLAKNFLKNLLVEKEDVDTRLSLALVLFKLEEFKEALEQFKVVIWSKPFHIRALKYCVKCLTKMGHPMENEMRNLNILKKKLFQFGELFFD